jgi:hypothetical protein
MTRARYIDTYYRAFVLSPPGPVEGKFLSPKLTDVPELRMWLVDMQSYFTEDDYESRYGATA